MLREFFAIGYLPNGSIVSNLIDAKTQLLLIELRYVTRGQDRMPPSIRLTRFRGT
jgi:hypothetical protein